MRASEDFGRFRRRAPTAMFFLGAGAGHPGLHNPDYDFPDALIEPAARILERIAEVDYDVFRRRPRLKRLVAHFHGDFRVGHQVVVPAWMALRARVRRHHQVAVAIPRVAHGRRARLAAASAGGGQQEQGAAGGAPLRDLAAIGSELLNQLLVDE